MNVIETLRSIDSKTLLAVHNDAAGKDSTRFASRSKGEDQTLRAIKKRCNNDAGICGIWLTESLDRVGAPVAAEPTNAPSAPVKKILGGFIKLPEGPLALPTAPVTTPVTTPVHIPLPAVKDKPKAKRGRKAGTNLAAPSGAPVACRAGTKRAMLVDLLSRENGATMDELLVAMSGGKKPWLPQTVRSGLGWDMKEKGYGVKSEVETDGVERFRLVLPLTFGGDKYPIPAHVEKAGGK